MKLASENSGDDQTVFWASIRQSNHNKNIPPILNLESCKHVMIISEKETERSLLSNATTRIQLSPKTVNDSFITCQPDTCQTGAGGAMEPDTFKNNLKYMKANSLLPVAVHANFQLGNEVKMERLQSNNLWIAINSSAGHWNGGCLEFNVPDVS